MRLYCTFQRKTYSIDSKLIPCRLKMVLIKIFYLVLPVVSVVESWPLPPVPDPVPDPLPVPVPKLSECPPDEH